MVHQISLRRSRVSAILGSLALVTLVACSKKSGVVPTPTPTPVPSPSAVTATVSSVALSLTGAAGVPASISGITATQTNATGPLAFATTTCYGTTPSPTSILVIPGSTSTSLINGTATITFGPIQSQAVGSCSFTVTPASGAALTIPVTVSP